MRFSKTATSRCNCKTNERRSVRWCKFETDRKRKLCTKIRKRIHSTPAVVLDLPGTCANPKTNYFRSGFGTMHSNGKIASALHTKRNGRVIITFFVTPACIQAKRASWRFLSGSHFFSLSTLHNPHESNCMRFKFTRNVTTYRAHNRRVRRCVRTGYWEARESEQGRRKERKKTC